MILQEFFDDFVEKGKCDSATEQRAKRKGGWDEWSPAFQFYMGVEVDMLLEAMKQYTAHYLNLPADPGLSSQEHAVLAELEGALLLFKQSAASAGSTAGPSAAGAAAAIARTAAASVTGSGVGDGYGRAIRQRIVEGVLASMHPCRAVVSLEQAAASVDQHSKSHKRPVPFPVPAKGALVGEVLQASHPALLCKVR